MIRIRSKQVLSSYAVYNKASNLSRMSVGRSEKHSMYIARFTPSHNSTMKKLSYKKRCYENELFVCRDTLIKYNCRVEDYKRFTVYFYPSFNELAANSQFSTLSYLARKVEDTTSDYAVDY